MLGVWGSVESGVNGSTGQTDSRQTYPCWLCLCHVCCLPPPLTPPSSPPQHTHTHTHLNTPPPHTTKHTTKTPKQGHFSERDAAHVMRQLLEFLEFAHDECNVVHRDIKPENLLLLDTDAPQSLERAAKIKAAGGNPEGVEGMALKVRVLWVCVYCVCLGCVAMCVCVCMQDKCIGCDPSEHKSRMA